ncbi:hypothetical protein ACSZOL_17245, partial [Aeromonas hydrophila]|uniref:hypothetical protein n=1 Tax=Aeromonas hydrophila TaxID=644 RepID=UPI003EC80B0E
LAVQRLISSSIVMLMSVISTHYDLSRISVGHYTPCPRPVPDGDAAAFLRYFVVKGRAAVAFPLKFRFCTCP